MAITLDDPLEDFVSPIQRVRRPINRMRRRVGLSPLGEPDPLGMTADQVGEELLSRRNSSSTSGLDYLLDTIDKFTGARAARGVLSGNSRELLSILPGSDTLGITDPQQSVSSGDLAKKWGLGDGLLANIGVGILTDPTTYLTLGGKAALTATGKVAQAAGALDDVADLAKAAGQTKRAFLRSTSIGDLARSSPEALTKVRKAALNQGLDFQALLQNDEALKGVGNIGLPFTKGRVFGAGKQGQVAGLVKGIDKGIDYGLEKIADPLAGLVKASPLGGAGTFAGNLAGKLYRAEDAAKRVVREKFDVLAGDTAHPVIQPMMKGLVKGLNAAKRATRGKAYGHFERMENIGEQLGLGGDDYQDFWSLAVEGTNPATVDQFSHIAPEMGDEAVAIGDAMRKGYDKQQSALEALGYPTNHYEEKDLLGETVGKFAPRYAEDEMLGRPGVFQSVANLARSTRPSDISRKAWTRGGLEFEGGGRGRYALRKFTQDTGVWDEARLGYKDIREGNAIIKANPGDQASLTLGRQMTRDGAKRLRGVREAVGERYVGLNPDSIEQYKSTRESLKQEIEQLHADAKLTGVLDQGALDMAEEGIGWINHKLSLPGKLVLKAGRDLPIQHRGKAIFDDVLRDMVKYENTSSRKVLTGRWVQSALARMGKMMNPDDPVAGSSEVIVPIRDALMELGFKSGSNATDRAIQNVASKMAGRFGNNMTIPDEYIRSNKLGIDRADFEELKRLSTAMSGPRNHSEGLMGVVDAMTDKFKLGVTQYFPAFHMRNKITAAAMNWMFDAGDDTRKGVMKYVAPFQDAAAFRKGEIVKKLGGHGVFDGMTDEQATRHLGELAWKEGITEGAGVGSEISLADDALRANESMSRDIFGGPGRARKSKRELLGQVWDPQFKSQYQGVGRPDLVARERIANTYARSEKVAREVGNAVEMDNRMSTFIALLKKGWNPEAAGNRVKELHFDYSALTQFEKSTMRRVMPFYTYSRKMIPLMLEEMLTNPGGKAAMAAKAADRLRGEGFLPEHIAGGLAIPYGGEDTEGNQRYLTGFDLPFEIINDVFKPGPTTGATLRDTGFKLLGSMNPLIKGPLETLTGKQFFSGRDLRDLDSNVGRIAQNIHNLPANAINALGGNVDLPDPGPPKKANILVEQALAMSPFSRVGTTARQLTDPRKWEDPLLGGLPIPTALGLNLLTGARVSDINVPQQQSLLSRELLTEQLSELPGFGTFEKAFIKPEVAKTLKDEDLETYLLYNYLEKAAQKKGRAAKKKKAKGQD